MSIRIQIIEENTLTETVYSISEALKGKTESERNTDTFQGNQTLHLCLYN